LVVLWGRLVVQALVAPDPVGFRSILREARIQRGHEQWETTVL
jgi:hypothetical protein